MPYVKVGPWVNGAPPALSAVNLDQVETQYDEAIATIGHGILTVAGFQINPATGTAGDPDHINDGSLFTAIVADAIGEYAEVLFVIPCHIRRFRYYGYAGQGGNGFWKLQYQDMDDAWVDWVLNIPTRLDSWSIWDATGGEVIAKGIRFVATTLDTQPVPDANIAVELEVKY